MPKKTFSVLATTAGLGLVCVLPAAADTEGDTGATFELTGGPLSITVPAATDLGTQPTGGAVQNIGGPLGTVQVTDERGLLVADWTTSVSSTDFTTEGSSIPNSAVTYVPGLSSVEVGTVATPGTGGPMSAPQTAYSAAGVGNNQVAWNPTINVTVPTQAVVGVYSATITHSVV